MPLLQVAIPAAQIYTIDASLSPEAAAVDYTAKLASVWGNEVRQCPLLFWSALLLRWAWTQPRAQVERE